MDIEAEIRAALGAVEQSFSKLDIEAWLNCFHPKRLMVLPGMVLAPESTAECQILLGSYIDNLKSQGYNKSHLDQLKVRPLTASTAMASVIWSRFNNDSLIERVGATYIFIKSNDKWLITVVTVHQDDV